MLTLITDRLTDLEALCVRHHVTSLSLFGSGTRSDFDPASSDLDFLVEFADLPPGELSRNYFAFAVALEDLFQRKVDLVFEGSITNPYRRASILADKQPLYNAA